MLAFVFAVDGSHLSVKHKTSDLFCAKGTQLCQLIVFFNFQNISKHLDLCYEIFIPGIMLNLICLIET